MPDLPPDLDLTVLAKETAALLGLRLAPHQLPGVLQNLALAARMHELVASLPLTREDEPAPVFVADGGAR